MGGYFPAIGLAPVDTAALLTLLNGVALERGQREAEVALEQAWQQLAAEREAAAEAAAEAKAEAAKVLEATFALARHRYVEL